MKGAMIVANGNANGVVIAEPDNIEALRPSPAEDATGEPRKAGSVEWNGLQLSEPAEVLLVSIDRRLASIEESFNNIAEAVSAIGQGGGGLFSMFNR